MNTKIEETIVKDVFNRWIEIMLRIGVYFALLLTVTAFILFIISGNNNSSGSHTTPSGLLQAALNFDPAAIASLSILVFFLFSFLPVPIAFIRSIIAKDQKLTFITLLILVFISSLIVFILVRF